MTLQERLEALKNKDVMIYTIPKGFSGKVFSTDGGLVALYHGSPDNPIEVKTIVISHIVAFEVL